jgi:hypothetical protein
LKARDELGAGIDDALVLLDISPVAQRLNSARGRARADRDKEPAFFTDLDDAARIVGSGDAALDGDVVRPFEGAAPRLRKIDEIHLSAELEEFVFGVEELQLAAVARREFEYRDARFHMPNIPNSSRTLRYASSRRAGYAARHIGRGGGICS